MTTIYKGYSIEVEGDHIIFYKSGNGDKPSEWLWIENGWSDLYEQCWDEISRRFRDTSYSEDERREIIDESAEEDAKNALADYAKDNFDKAKPVEE